jgi:cellulose synthase/poly-beta-1,6-N-acetylglucosamine synthase-like glycosyltransferase
MVGTWGPSEMPCIGEVFIAVLYLLALVGLFLYGLNAYVMLAIHWRNRCRGGQLEKPRPPTVWPMVTVQLPLYNERYVAQRLLEAIGNLDYPMDRLEIQLLDDSTDETTDILREIAQELRARGLTITHRCRPVRTGYKAGALAVSFAEARGEFIAIFDADFVPSPDFLRQTIPYFAEPQVAVVQARWGHLNRDFSLLTVAQSFGIDGHFGVEQSARSWGDLFLNFNGTAGVWRKAAIADAGGWSADTLTEDLDLSYRAQLRGWRIVYVPDLNCPAELPALMSGFKSQQCRWAKGSMQTALKLLPAVFRTRRSPWVKYQAFIHLTYYMVHPLMLFVTLSSGSMIELQDQDLFTPLWWGVGLACSLVSLGPLSMMVYAQRVLYPQWWRRIWQLPSLMVFGVGIALSTSLAVLGAFWGKDREFVRTPKFGIGSEGGALRGKVYMARRFWDGLPEIGLGSYAAWATCQTWGNGRYATLPFLILYAAGFLVVGVLTILQSTRGGMPTLSTTGAKPL